jgi:hypothetical protein
MNYYTRITIKYSNPDVLLQLKFDNWNAAYSYLCDKTCDMDYLAATIHTDKGQIITSLRTIK